MKIGEFGPPNRRIQVNIQDFKGIVGVDIREWYQANDGNMHPTKKGLRLSSNDISKLIPLLERAETELYEQLPQQQQAAQRQGLTSEEARGASEPQAER